jgi:hypothetical protein
MTDADRDAATTWTRTLPTQSGWYWMRIGSCVYVVEVEGRMVSVRGTAIPIDRYHGWYFFGPLAPPPRDS